MGLQKRIKKDLLPWLEELGSPYEVIGMDHNGLQSINWGVYGLPETFIIQDGLVKYRHVGPIMKRDLEIFKNLTKKNNDYFYFFYEYYSIRSRCNRT